MTSLVNRKMRWSDDRADKDRKPQELKLQSIIISWSQSEVRNSKIFLIKNTNRKKCSSLSMYITRNNGGRPLVLPEITIFFKWSIINQLTDDRAIFGKANVFRRRISPTFKTSLQRTRLESEFWAFDRENFGWGLFENWNLFVSGQIADWAYGN